MILLHCKIIGDESKDVALIPDTCKLRAIRHKTLS